MSGTWTLIGSPVRRPDDLRIGSNQSARAAGGGPARKIGWRANDSSLRTFERFQPTTAPVITPTMYATRTATTEGPGMAHSSQLAGCFSRGRQGCESGCHDSKVGEADRPAASPLVVQAQSPDAAHQTSGDRRRGKQSHDARQVQGARGRRRRRNRLVRRLVGEGIVTAYAKARHHQRCDYDFGCHQFALASPGGRRRQRRRMLGNGLNGRVRIALLGSAARGGCKGGGGTAAPAGRGIVTAGPGAASAASNWREVKSMSEKVRRKPRLLLP
jgi:hypothetical protein